MAQAEKNSNRTASAGSENISIQDRKARLRREKLAVRKALCPEERAEKSERIAGRVLQLPFVREAANVLCYVSYREEVETQELIRRLLERGIRVYAPKVAKDAGLREMEFYELSAGTPLTEGFCRIPEPSGESRRFRPEERSAADTAVLLPGIVFDRAGGRIGYGGGYYDRYLERMEKAEVGFSTAGLCFSCQTTDKVPQEETDRRVDAVVTETEILAAEKENKTAVEREAENGTGENGCSSAACKI